MKLLVTGGAGFIGSAVVRQSIDRGLTVLNFDKLTYASNLENLRAVETHDNYSFVEGDICDIDIVNETLARFRPDVIMHLAAESHVDRSIDGPKDFIETNIVGTFTLLEAARKYIADGLAPEIFRFHHVSTDEVFGSLGAEGAFSEESPYQPNSPYSASKASSDMLVRAWGETFDLPFVISNCSNNYGPFQFPEKLIPVVILAAAAGQPIPVYGKGDNVRDWLYVSDHANALLAVAEHGRIGETYCIGGRAERSNIELVKMICAVLDRLLPASDNVPHESLITYVQDRPGHDKRYAVDCSKIERDLDWTPEKTLESALEETVQWYLCNQDWIEHIKSRGHTASRLGLKAKSA